MQKARGKPLCHFLFFTSQRMQNTKLVLHGLVSSGVLGRKVLSWQGSCTLPSLHHPSYLHAWCFILDAMGVWWQHHHSSSLIKRKSMNQANLITLSQGCSCQILTEVCFHFRDFPYPKVAAFSSSVFSGYGLLLCVLSGAMLSSSLAEVL